MAINKNKVMEAAQRFVERGQADKAIKEYLKVVAEDPKDVRVWLKIGDLHAKKGAKQEATETYLKVAAFYGEQGFTNKAIAVYKQILKIDPRLISANIKLAELYRQQGLLSDAMQQYELVAAFYHREGKAKEALAATRIIVELDPENVATRIKLAELYSKENQTAEAVAEFERAAETLRLHQRADDFIKVAERLVWHQPENQVVQRELATLYLRRGDPRRALQKLQICFKANSADVDTLGLLATAFEALGQGAKTVSVCKELARIHREAGDEARAVEVYRRILATDPDDADAREALGAQPGRPARRGVSPLGVAPEASGADSSPPARDTRPSGQLVSPLVSGLVGSGSSPRPRIAEPITHEREVGDDAGVTEEAVLDGPDEVEVETDLYADDPVTGTGEVAALSAEDRAEAYAEEIVRILTETDVYVKYGLHQKALDHLRRVFDLDPHNVEAHEKRKEVLLAMGRRAEAAAALVTLIELVAPYAPNQAAAYLGELRGFDPFAERAVELAERYGLDFGDESTAESPLGGAVEVDVFGDEPMEPDGPDGELEIVAETDDVPVGEEGVGLELGVEAQIYPDEEEAAAGDFLDAGSAGEVLELDFEELHGGPAEGARTRPGSGELEPVTAEHEAPAVASISPTTEENDDLELDAEPDGRQMGTIADTAVRAPVDAEAAEFFEVLTSPGVDEMGMGERTVAGGTSLEDDLDEADFFVAQNLFGEARGVLVDLLSHHPNHPLLLAKLLDLDALEQASEAPQRAVLVAQTEDPGANEPFDPEQSVPVRPPEGKDADRHWDLGIAYVEMGLLEQAVREFGLVVDSQGRGAKARLMIGRCQIARGKPSEAISEFKRGLYCEGIEDVEALDLYFEIGIAYETLGDPREALYYLEKVAKRDRSFQDVAARVEAIKSSLSRLPLVDGTTAEGSSDEDRGSGETLTDEGSRGDV